MVKIVFFINFLFLYISNIFAQNNNRLVGKSMPQSMVSQWGAERSVWSHSYSQVNSKPLIDFNAIDKWVSLVEDHTDISLSPDGNYFAYGIGNYMSRRLDTLIIQSTGMAWRKSFVDALPGFFSCDSKQYIFLNKEKELNFLETSSGKLKIVKNVLSYIIPHDYKNEYLAYKLNDTENTLVFFNLLTGKEETFKNVKSFSFDVSNQWLVCRTGAASDTLLMYNFSKEVTRRFLSVVDYVISKDGAKMLLRSNYDLRYINMFNDANTLIWSAEDSTIKLDKWMLDESGNQVVFSTKELSQREAVSTDISIWYWREGMRNVVLKFNNKSAGFPNDVFVEGLVNFTNDGHAIQVSLQKISDVRKRDSNAVSLDVWSYKDTLLQSIQLNRSNELAKYQALINVETGKIVWNDNKYEKLYFCIKEFALIGNNHTNGYSPRYGDRFWEKEYYRDSIWLVSLTDGARKFICAKKIFQHELKPSPDGRYLVYFDRDKGSYISYNILTNENVNICSGIPGSQFGMHRFSNSNDEVEGVELVYWLPGNDRLIVYDDYDIWQLDPAGRRSPINLTNGYGRKHNILFRLQDEYSGWIKRFGSSLFIADDTLLLKAFNIETKFNGYYTARIGQESDPQQLYMGPYFMDKLLNTYGVMGGMSPIKAANSKVYIIKRESDTLAPNYFLTKDFRTFRPLTNLKPHHEYNWLTAELHNFKRMDGSYSQGILYKPSDFDSTKKYPVIVSFYLWLSDRRYQYPQAQYVEAPNLIWGTAWMVSHGYLVFMPDIQFKKDHWGPSTVNTMDGAARYLNSLNFVDGKHIGACGHSNSGRFGYYLLTHSHSFAAMSVGAGHGGGDVLSDALSLSNDGRNESMLSFHEVDAAGAALGPIWQNKQSWIEHTAVLQADKVTTPFLLFYNNKDPDPVRYGRELYIALRRLEKKTWWLQYDNGGHSVYGKNAQDFTIRFTQFFDHYLKESPAPRWMTKGILASVKGIETGYELDPSGNCGLNKNKCKVCNKWNEKYRKKPEKFLKPFEAWLFD
ncbi:alpha/beta hydrolase family protein [Longitalea luteola]|uniref:alpha/beta hydrolase family protein n=1 Tax=Longitalea luteola TaxID=2812563 RepID=UPI001A978006|nr:hypothetical protein [Longitalea luteola]